MVFSLRRLFGIRFKLVFMSSFLLVIPWLGYQYILEMEDYLRRSQEQTILGTAQALATALNERPELFDEANYSPARRSNDLYIYPIFHPLLLDDGSVLDWREYQQYEVEFGSKNYLPRRARLCDKAHVKLHRETGIVHDKIFCLECASQSRRRGVNIKLGAQDDSHSKTLIDAAQH